MLPATIRLALSLAGLVALAGCAVNPATGKRQIMLISEAQEIELGRENDKAIVAEMGLYDDPQLASYVSQLGQKLAAVSEKPNLTWTFRLVDDPVVNAFALPGGFIYVTRGILAHFDNEAELAGVLGHEIGHVTARHSANQLSKAQLLQGGLMAATVFGPEAVGQLGELAGQGLGLLFLKFGRDDERQADDLGLRYMTKAAYDPRPLVEVFETLERVGEASEAGDVPNWLSTHPAPENRAERISAAIAASGVPANPTTVDRGAYLTKLEGVIFGEDPRDGFFRENLFLHPRLEFQLEFPEGWKMQNQKAAVLAVSAQDDAMVGLTLAKETSAGGALNTFFSNQQIARVAPEVNRIHGLPTAGQGFRAQTQSGAVAGLVAFVEHSGQVYRLLGYAPEAVWSQRSGAVSSAINSFDHLKDASAKNVEPGRVHIVRPTKNMNAEEFARAFDSSAPAKTLALINQIDEGESFLAGQPYKVVRGGPPS